MVVVVEEGEGEEERGGLLGEQGASVHIHIYDLMPNVNDYTHAVGLGLYHSSVEVYGYEFAFGGHDDARTTGIYAVPASLMPRTPGARVGRLGGGSESTSGSPDGGDEGLGYTYRSSIRVGATSLSKEEVQAVIQSMGRREYTGTRYHMLQQNCNAFTDDLCRRLTGIGAPGWINRVAGWAVRLQTVPCLQSLQGLVPAGYVPQLQLREMDGDEEEEEEGRGAQRKSWW
jgi:hypothetical protein